MFFRKAEWPLRTGQIRIFEASLSFMHNNQGVGRVGESLACRYLQSIGWTIVERNYRCRLGEIDIVGRDGESLVFCEVKTRTTGVFGGPAAALGAAKCRRLRRLAEHYLLSHGIRESVPCRFDLLGIEFDRLCEPKVFHLTGIL